MAPELGPALIRDFIFSYSLRMCWRKKSCWEIVPSNMRKGICHTLILSSKNFMIDRDRLRNLWSCVCLWQAKDILCSDGNSLQLNLHLSLSERNQEKGWTEKKPKKDDFTTDCWCPALCGAEDDPVCSSSISQGTFRRCMSFQNVFLHKRKEREVIKQAQRRVSMWRVNLPTS